MTRDEFVTVMADVLDVGVPLTVDTSLDQVEEWDSVNALRLMVFLEHGHGFAVDVEAFLAATRISDLLRACGPAATVGGHDG